MIRFPPNVVALRERNLADVLRDLREARDDYDNACAAIACSNDEDADDRASEADDRIESLRTEFSAMFAAATGLTWKQVQAAIEEAVL